MKIFLWNISETFHDIYYPFIYKSSYKSVRNLPTPSETLTDSNYMSLLICKFKFKHINLPN